MSCLFRVLLISVCSQFLLACSSITVKEESFLRDRQQAVLYHLIRFQGATRQQISAKTSYSIVHIEKALSQLREKDLIELHDDKWQITDKYRTEEPTYVASIETFHPEKLAQEIKEHEFLLTRIDNGRLQVAAFISKSPEETWIIFPGNGFNIVPDISEVTKLLAPNRNIYVMDYPGMGDSSGKMTVESLKSAAYKLFNHVTEQESVIDTKLIIYGFSLGGFVAVDIANRNRVDALVLDSTAPDMQSWVDANVPLYARALVDVEVDEKLKAVSNLDGISGITSPMLLIVGSEDSITPPSLMNTLMEAAKMATFKEMVILEGVEHGESLDHPDFNLELNRFMSKISGAAE